MAYCLRRFQPLVQQLARSHWIDHIKRNKQNASLLGPDNDLESFLFETSRQSLAIVQTGLRKISNRCFYCGRSVSEADVAQCRVNPAAVVTRHPINHLVNSLSACCKPLAVQAARLQPAPETFRRRVVPAVTLAAHGTFQFAGDPVLVALGAAIRRERSERGLSQEALAVDADLDRSYMGGIERGEHNLTVMNLVKIAGALKLSPSKLLDSASL